MATALAVVLAAGALLLAGRDQGLLQGLMSDRVAVTRTVEAAPGKRVALTLADGTTVKLHPGATLHFPERFEPAGRRTVRLDGEAYFDVARDTSRSFLVRTGRAHVEVLGTAFNVQAYGDARAPGDAHRVEVTVAEGRVALRSASPEAPAQAAAGQVVLAAGDVGHLAPGGRLYAQRDVGVGGRLAWTRGALDFRSAPLQDVARGMERWYGIEVALEDSARIASRELTATFDDESPSAAAEVVAFLLGVDHEMQDGRLVFRPALERAAGTAPAHP